ncbi:hypothetical protein G6F56_009167 [Rhizopus delemar]|nr:hypothetical protein G6F56_009167 [Rhizopus delemar]
MRRSEYLWRYRRQSNLQEGLNQALRSVSFDPSESRTLDHQHGRVQLETQQGDWTVVSQVERMSDGLYQPPAFVRLDNEEFTEENEELSGADSNSDSDYEPSIEIHRYHPRRRN